MDSPTAWNINDKFDKFDYLSVNSDGLRVDYTGNIIAIFLSNFILAFRTT